MAVAATARFWSISNVGLGGDESVYAGQALVLAGHHDMERFFLLVSRGSSNFLVHQTLEAISYSFMDFSEFSTRLPSAIMSTLTIIPIFLLGRELYGKWAGLTGGFLFAINGYSIAIGRLALLDSTMVFFFTFSMFFLAKWLSGRDDRPVWLYLLAISTAIAVMAKIVAFLIIPIAIVAIVSSRKVRKLPLNTAGIALVVFAASLAPAIYQLISYYETFKEFFSEGASRVINVPPTYYLEKLSFNAGVAFLILMAFGIGVALFHRKKEDLLCLFWIAIVFAFFQIQPIKGWNYLLPIIPAATILIGRAFVSVISFLRPIFFVTGAKQAPNTDGTSMNELRASVPRGKMVAGIVVAWIFIASSYYQVFTSITNITYERPFAGLREAAFWLRENAPGKGVMTLSQGSAQYVLSIYGKIDAYPFGNYHLHTILPGGEVIPGPPNPDPLVQNGTVSFFVYYVSPSINGAGDDPIHDPGTPTAGKFVQFIHKYQSKVRHIVYDEYEGLNGEQVRKARAFIYEVGKRAPEPTIDSATFDIGKQVLHVEGSGFFSDAYVHVYLGRTLLRDLPTDEIGSFDADLNIPAPLLCEAKIYAFDEHGNALVVPVEQCNG
jgi:hypothetical protein